MHGSRWLAASLGALLLFGAHATVEATAGSGITSSLSGRTKDELGHALAGVEVLVLSNTAAGEALGRVVSDAEGRFVLGTLSPGVYRVAAIKPGYLASIGRVNTLLRGTVDLVLRPIPKDGEPGAAQVAPDLSWTLRLPPRSILHDVGAESLLADRATGGARAFALRMQEALTGQVDHTVALGSWRTGASGSSSSLEGAQTTMRLGGTLGERGAIMVRGARGTLDAAAASSSPGVSRDAANVGVDVSYDTTDDSSVAVSAYYARGDFEVDGVSSSPKGGLREGQRSWGYDARFTKQVDPSSQVAVNLGYRDASRAVDGVGLDGWSGADGSNRALAAEGSYESTANERHTVRIGVRAQRLDLSSPESRFAPLVGAPALDGAAGWSVLLDGEDRWAPAGPVVVAYGVAVRQGFDGPLATTMTPRVGATLSTHHLKVRGEVSYLAAANLSAEATTSPAPNGASPLGYTVEVDAAAGPATRWSATAAYAPFVADRWSTLPASGGGVFVSDGRASDRVLAIGLERTAAAATVSVRVARGRAEGALAPTLDEGLPFLVLGDRVIDYDLARVGTRASRAGAALAVEYRALRESAPSWATIPVRSELKTVTVEYMQDLVRLGGGRATCRFLLAARTAFDAEDAAPGLETRAQSRRFAALQQRINAGVSLAF